MMSEAISRKNEGFMRYWIKGISATVWTDRTGKAILDISGSLDMMGPSLLALAVPL
jgi:hypothetical protein